MTLIGLPASIEELLVAALLTLVVTLIYKFLMNQNELKELKEKMKEKQQKSKELQKSNPEEAKKVMSEMLNLSNKQMRMSMKPMFVTLIIFAVIVLPVLPNLFPGTVVNLPVSLPLIGKNLDWANSLEWFWWYVIVSIPLNSIFRKMLGVEL